MIAAESIAFTAYPVTDLARARSFYEGTLGLPVELAREEEGKGFVEYDLAGATLSIINVVPGWAPTGHGPAVAIEVRDMDTAVEMLRTKGVSFVMEPFSTPVCRMAVITDPDGNQLIIHKRNPSV